MYNKVWLFVIFRLDNAFDALISEIVFNSLVYAMALYKVKIKLSNVVTTILITHVGLYIMVKITVNLCKSLSTYYRKMAGIIQDFIVKYTAHCFDYVIVFVKNNPITLSI